MVDSGFDVKQHDYEGFAAESASAVGCAAACEIEASAAGASTDSDQGVGGSGDSQPDLLADSRWDPDSPVPPYTMDDLDRKVVEHFAGKIVRKDLTGLMKSGSSVPTFVLEYLLGMYCSSDDPYIVEQGLDRIRKIMAQNYVRPTQSEEIKSRIRQMGVYTIIDKVNVRLDEYEDIYEASFTSLAIDPIEMPEEYVERYAKMLSGGIWCIVKLAYVPVAGDADLDDPFDDSFRPGRDKTQRGTGKRRKVVDSPFKLESLTPIQMPSLQLDSFVEERSNFTTDEWERLLLRSAGIEPDALTDRQRLHFLERMVPLVERNYNLVELGPRGTGKSHLYSEVSPYSYLLSGGQTTVAKLFSDNRGGRGRTSPLGLVGHWDCVAFDEVAGIRFKDRSAVDIMKNYMANGSFGRGNERFNAEASMAFEGNINDTPESVLKTSHLFDPFPPEFNNDSAFFDRIHCYLPGWEVPKMRSELVSKRYGLVTDCLSEFCHLMRARDFTGLLDRYFRLNDACNIRDETGVRRTFSGLAKLLFPDERMSREDARRIMDYAVEGRRRVKEQLKIMAGVEFNDVNLGYTDLEEGEPVVVFVPEQSSSALIPEVACQPGHVFGIGRSASGELAVYRLENRATTGDGHFSFDGAVGRDNGRAAWSAFETSFGRVAHGIKISDKNFLLYCRDLQNRGSSDELSLAEYVGLCSAACNRSVLPGLAVPGVIRLSGSMDPIVDLENVFRVSKNA